MSTLADRISKARKQSKFTQQQVADRMNVARTSVSHWENGAREPDLKTIRELAELFDVTFEYLVGAHENIATKTKQEYLTNQEWKPQLNSKDERDIQKKIQSILDDLDNPEDSLMYNGEPLELDEMTKELLRASMENGLRIAKIKSKEKYTPNKYR